mgnify:CR=1 FL=1
MTARWLSLDERIMVLSPDVDEELREGLKAALRTLRDVQNPIGTILSLSRLSLLLLDKVFESVGERRPSDNLYSCIARVSSGDKEVKIEGLGLMPDERATYLHTIRILSNKADHAVEKLSLIHI